MIGGWYNRVMYAWSIDENALRKDPILFLTQLINFGLNGEKINERALRRHFSKLTDLDPARRRYLHFLLYDRLDDSH